MVRPTEVEGVQRYPLETIKAQISSCLAAWGMPPDQVEITADVIADADACGIDTHGLSLLTTYESRLQEGILTIDAHIEVVKETSCSALIDAGGGLGYVPGVMATDMVIAKGRQVGLAAAAVRNSNHFGATGYYTRRMAAAGLIGFATTNGAQPRSAPTLGTEARLSTNPFAFAAPARRHPVFSLDMATTTVAAGKLRVYANEGIDLPIGWVNDLDGNPLTDSKAVYESQAEVTMTPLGGTLEGGSYKGYGLAAMVEILSAGLSGASLVTSPNHGRRTPGTMELGHFFLAIDPTIFRPAGEFEATVDDLIEDLRSTRPVSPDQPVMVAGEPEEKMRAERRQTGIPVPPGLRAKLREITARAGAAYLLD